MHTTTRELLEKYGLRPQMPPIWDHQVSGAFQECNRMGWYRHILGRIFDEDAFALVWGKVFHRITEIWQTTQDLQAIINYINENIPEVVEDRYGRDRNRMVQAFTTWATYHQQNPIEILRTEQPTMVGCLDEACPYSDTGCSLVYGGRLDRIVRWQQMVGPLDIKTSVMDEVDPISEYKPNHQIMGYIWLTAHLIGSHPWGCIVEKVICNKSKLLVKRFPVPYSKDLIREWVDGEKLRQTTVKERFGAHSHSEQHWEQNHFRCWKPYPCHYRDVCLAPRDMEFRLKYLRDNTKERRWDFNDPDGETNGRSD